jgi:tetratricopeptide (TPR) repeat protein
MRKRTPLLIGLSLLVLAFTAYWLPPVQRRLSWRVDFAMAYIRGVVNPVKPLPTALPQPQVRTTRMPSPTPTAEPAALPTLPAASPTLQPTSTPTLTPTPIPQSASLASPPYEKQDINNCGPATLAMYLRYYGWEGDQFDIANELKPQREDRNVNVEELAYFVRTKTGFLYLEYRVGGNIDLLKKFIAAGIPVMVEESFKSDVAYWPNDDLWAAHYNLITGYDDASQTFTSQDSYYGADLQVSYENLDEYWQSFNRVYILVYPPERQAEVQAILGEDWDPDVNRQKALEQAQRDTEIDPQNAFAWFNLGTNLVYFERYDEAGQAYDTAREIGLPQRMLRYQFGPFLAYFHGGRIDDLMALADYAIQRTPNAEEAYLWRGWGHYRQGNTNAALADFQQALSENRNYADAQYALNYVRENP